MKCTIILLQSYSRSLIRYNRTVHSSGLVGVTLKLITESDLHVTVVCVQLLPQVTLAC